MTYPGVNMRGPLFVDRVRTTGQDDAHHLVLPQNLETGRSRRSSEQAWETGKYIYIHKVLRI